MPKANGSPADALRDVSPREFVGARNALAAKLARSGKQDAARAVSRLRRPSPVVWALNRTAAARPRELDALVRAVDELRRAQLGQGELRTATDRYRAAFDMVVRHARGALHEAGSAATAALERRTRGTLLAAVADRRLRRDLAAGRLAEEHPDPGFAVLAQGPTPAKVLRDRPAKKTRSTTTPDAARARGASVWKGRGASSRAEGLREKEARRMARQAFRDARRIARRAEREVEALSRIARRKERVAQAAEEGVAALRRRLQEREQRSAALRAAADRAREAQEKAAGRRRDALAGLE